MCDPTTVAVLATGMQSYGTMQQGQAAKDAAEFNVAMGEIKAKDTYAQAANDKQNLSHQFLQEKAAGRTSAAASGLRLNTGSTLDWENSLTEIFVSDKATIDEDAARNVWAIRNQQELDTSAGKNAITSAYISSASSLLSGAGTVASQGQGAK